MPRPKDRKLAEDLKTGLKSFHKNNQTLPGICNPRRLETLVEQMIESIRRVKYISILSERDICELRADPSSELFDPLKASIWFQRKNQIDEAFWMVFLFVHFGGPANAVGWYCARRIYGRLGAADRWDWAATSSDPRGFRVWLDTHLDQLRPPDGQSGFGNHRKYQSLDACSSNGTGAAFETYVRWIAPPRTHKELLEQEIRKVNGDPRRAFGTLYCSMSAVASFGRLAKFDYLTMVSKLKLAAIEPDSPYISGSTGPRQGAELLFGVSAKPAVLNQNLVELEATLGVGMQVIEDALCNWQKSPDHFIPFRG